MNGFLRLQCGNGSASLTTGINRHKESDDRDGSMDEPRAQQETSRSFYLSMILQDLRCVCPSLPAMSFCCRLCTICISLVAARPLRVRAAMMMLAPFVTTFWRVVRIFPSNKKQFIHRVIWFRLHLLRQVVIWKFSSSKTWEEDNQSFMLILFVNRGLFKSPLIIVPLSLTSMMLRRLAVESCSRDNLRTGLRYTIMTLGDPEWRDRQ